MIPYADLVAALTAWRTRNGLPVGPAHAPAPPSEAPMLEAAPAVALPLGEDDGLSIGTDPVQPAVHDDPDSEILVSSGDDSGSDDIFIESEPPDDYEDINMDGIGDDEETLVGGLEIDRDFQAQE